MVRFTVPDEVARRVEAAANARGMSIEDAVVEALIEWTERNPAELAELPELSFVAIGASRSDPAERADVLEAFIGCAASGQREAFDIHRERAVASARRSSTIESGLEP